jgi:hypothetical protein
LKGIEKTVALRNIVALSVAADPGSGILSLMGLAFLFAVSFLIGILVKKMNDGWLIRGDALPRYTDTPLKEIGKILSKDQQ